MVERQRAGARARRRKQSDRLRKKRLRNGREHDREHQTLSWLRCEMERDTAHFVSLNCALCKKYEGHLQSLKNLNTAWITGSTNQKVSSILDNEGSGVHKAALARKRAEAARAHGELVMQSSPIGCALSTLDLPTRARVG